jgi:hypothetical protein
MGVAPLFWLNSIAPAVDRALVGFGQVAAKVAQQ